MAKGKYQKWLTKEGLSQLADWSRNGATDEILARKMGIGTSTLYKWKKEHVEIVEALKQGKEVVDAEVENSLLKRAMGMTTKTTIYKMVKIDDDVLKAKRMRFLNAFKLEHPEMTKQRLTMAALENVPTYEQIPMSVNEVELAPDTSAAIFWLKNRRPEQFRDHSFQELNVAQAKKALADTRKAEAEADISEAKARIINANTDSTEAKVAEYLDKLDDVLDGDSNGDK